MAQHSSIKDSKFFLTAKVSALAVLPLVLLLLPSNYFDQGRSLCLFTMLTGEHCWGCGMTRACMRLIHLDFSGAARFNKIAFLAFPLLCFLYLNEAIKTIRKYRHISRK